MTGHWHISQCPDSTRRGTKCELSRVDATAAGSSAVDQRTGTGSAEKERGVSPPKADAHSAVACSACPMISHDLRFRCMVLLRGELGDRTLKTGGDPQFTHAKNSGAGNEDDAAHNDGEKVLQE